MFANRTHVFLVVCILAVIGTMAAERDPAALMQADRAFAQATETRGLDGWMEFMAPNAVLLRDEPLVGIDTIRLGMAKSFAVPGFRLRWEPSRAEFVGDSGDIGYTIGRYQATYNGKDGRPERESGSYLTTWQKQKDASWRVVSDIGSPDPKK